MTTGREIDLRHNHLMALEFLKDHPDDEIGVVETEEQLAAAFVYAQLLGAGLITGTLQPGGGGVRLTSMGELAIAERGVRQ